jgi:hypothetical protein
VEISTAWRARRHAWGLLAASALLCAGAAELALRAFLPEVGRLRQLVVATDDERGFAPRPGIRLRYAGVFQTLARPVVWQTNSEGMRHDGEVGPPDARFRIATYGDSETFGWSIALDETFQRRMQALDPRVEVLNFGVPGYNVTNVRDQLERSVPRIAPDLVIYLVNKNDFNEPVTFSPLSRSHLLLHLRFLWHFSVGKQLRLLVRDTPERLELFAREIERMTEFLEARQTPFVLGFLKWRNRENVREHASNGRFHRELVDVKAVLAGEPREDLHYTRTAHARMAQLFCRVIAQGQDGGCVPPGWQRATLAGGGGPRAVSPRRRGRRAPRRGRGSARPRGCARARRARRRARPRPARTRAGAARA